MWAHVGDEHAVSSWGLIVLHLQQRQAFLCFMRTLYLGPHLPKTSFPELRGTYCGSELWLARGWVLDVATLEGPTSLELCTSCVFLLSAIELSSQCSEAL